MYQMHTPQRVHSPAHCAAGPRRRRVLSLRLLFDALPGSWQSRIFCDLRCRGAAHTVARDPGSLPFIAHAIRHQHQPPAYDNIHLRPPFARILPVRSYGAPQGRWVGGWVQCRSPHLALLSSICVQLFSPRCCLCVT